MPELIWDGKYDKDGRRVAPLRVALPFQTVETVNETAQQRQLSIDRFLGGRDAEWRNRLIWGDNKYVLPSLLQEFAGSEVRGCPGCTPSVWHPAPVPSRHAPA